MDNGMENMLGMYLFETNTLLEELDERLINAEKEDNFTEEDVNNIFRIMHTVKGSSAMMEFGSLMTIAHRIEDLFFFIRENGIATLNADQRSQLFNLMFRSTDLLRSEVHKIETNQPLSENIDPFVAEVNTLLQEIGASGAPQKEGKPLLQGAVSQENGYPLQLRIYFDEGSGMEHLRALLLVTSLKERCDDFIFTPSDVETNPETASVIIENGFILAFPDEDALDRAVQMVKSAANIKTYEVLRPTAPLVATAQKIDTGMIVQKQAESSSTPQKAEAAAANPVNNSKQSLISVNLSKLDSLMAIVGEIVITESMVTSSPEIQGIKLDNFTKSARQLRKLTNELQDIVMSIRMVPISGVFHKMNRIVRDMGQKLGKEVRLTLVGESIEVDKAIVDSIGDPIMHIVRNAMDHGLEQPEERLAAGKSAEGEIILTAEHTGSDVIISIEDNGSGIQPEKVLAKARKNGLLTKPENEYSKKEILNFLMTPGFSTNESVTEFSGRGVGMDVVKKNIEKVGGVVTLSSEEGMGTIVRLKIPLTLAIVDGMKFSVGDSIFTVPITHIRQSFKVKSEDVIYGTSQNEMVFKMGQFYPVLRLHDLYEIETEITDIEEGVLIWVEAREKSFCLFVDRLLGKQQVVVKPLSIYLNKFNIKSYGIEGCTILGDGSISIILDAANLYAAVNKEEL